MSDMRIEGRAWKYGDNIDTDGIYPSKYLVTFEPEEVARHVMEGTDPTFVRKMERGDIIVAGDNFGCGSAREQAAMALRCAGVGAVVAESFSRTFFRNAINLGLPVLEARGVTAAITPGDRVRVDLADGWVLNVMTGELLPAVPLPQLLLRILGKGGAIAYYGPGGPGERGLRT